MQKRYQKKHRKNASKIEFWPPCWPPKSAEIPPKSDAERSLFRDAMQIANKSSEINRPHSLLGVQMATHMIRSSPSIHPSIHPSIDVSLVALIIVCVPNSSQKSTKILQNLAKKLPESIPNLPTSLQHRS